LSKDRAGPSRILETTMPTIKKATIKAYDPATHTATVQIAGSLGVWLTAIRVATDIPAADVVAGRQCTVLFLDPANQDDAVVLTIQGALPSGGGGGVTDHGALTGLGDDDHPQYGALAQAETWAALQTFGAGLKLSASQTIQDSGGTGRILLATASPNLTITGVVQIDSGGIFVRTTPLTDRPLMVRADAGHVAVADFSTNSGISIGTSGAFYALIGTATPGIAAGAAPALTVAGLYYTALATGSGGWTLSELIGARVQVGAISVNTNVGTITTAYGLQVAGMFIAAATTLSITTYIGADIKNPATAKLVDFYGLRIADPTLNTGVRRLLELGGTLGTQPNLRLEGGNPTTPGAGKGRSQLLLTFNENGQLALRRVEWVDSGAAGGAGIPANTKVLVAV